MSRPYAHHTTAQLADLAEAGNAAVRREIIEELRYRKMPGAKRLLSRLEAAPAHATSSAQNGRRVKKGSLKAAAPQRNASAPPKPRPDVSRADASEVGIRALSVPDSDAAQRYEVVRHLFTTQAEILGRWGMSELMPQPQRELVFAEWRRLLGSNPSDHPLGLSLRDLESDIEALKIEQSASVIVQQAKMRAGRK